QVRGRRREVNPSGWPLSPGRPPHMTRRELLHLSAVGLPGGLLPRLAFADEHAKPKSPDEMIDAYLAARVKEIVPRFMDGAKTKAEWEAARPRLKREFLDML